MCRTRSWVQILSSHNVADVLDLFVMLLHVGHLGRGYGEIDCARGDLVCLKGYAG